MRGRRRNPDAKAPGPKDVEIGQRIRAQRLLCRLSQTELADAIGVTFQQVQKYEQGVNRVGAGRLARIAEVLSVPVAFFSTAPPARRRRPAGSTRRSGCSAPPEPCASPRRSRRCRPMPAGIFWRWSRSSRSAVGHTEHGDTLRPSHQ